VQVFDASLQLLQVTFLPAVCFPRMTGDPIVFFKSVYNNKALTQLDLHFGIMREKGCPTNKGSEGLDLITHGQLVI
jgi:hypothetical protein